MGTQTKLLPMGTEKLPSGRWRGSVQHNGVRRRTATFATKAEAKKAEAALLLELEAETGPAARRPSTIAAITVGRLLDMRHEAGGMSVTYAAEWRRVTDKLPDSIKNRLITSITPMHAAQWWPMLTRDGWTPHRVSKAHVVLSSAFTTAVRWGLVRTNPLRDVAPPAAPQAEIHVPDASTVGRIVAAADADDPTMGALVRVLVDCGLRRGEVVGIKWGDIVADDTGTKITVRRAVSYAPDAGVVVKETKTGAKGRRTLRVSQPTAEALAALKRYRAGQLTIEAVMPTQFVFSVTGDVPWRPDYVQFRWAKICVDAGVRCRLHELRHAFVSGMLERGENPVRVARMAGHARTSTTLDIYGHLLADG
jgi:integrase